jgi:hypothetical protein
MTTARIGRMTEPQQFFNWRAMHPERTRRN